MTTTSAPLTVCTVGHSTRSLHELAVLVLAHGVAAIADVRSLPRSRRHPQFNRESMPEALSAYPLAYTHLPGLGGLRRPRPDSPNTAWDHAGFRGYADHMQTPVFERSLEALIDLTRQSRVAVMCAEKVPWRCHRALLADALTVRGIRVEHILTETRRDLHALHPAARADGVRLTYPSPTPSLPGFPEGTSSRSRQRAEISRLEKK